MGSKKVHQPSPSNAMRVQSKSPMTRSRFDKGKGMASLHKSQRITTLQSVNMVPGWWVSIGWGIPENEREWDSNPKPPPGPKPPIYHCLIQKNKMPNYRGTGRCNARFLYRNSKKNWRLLQNWRCFIKLKMQNDANVSIGTSLSQLFFCAKNLLHPFAMTWGYRIVMLSN